MNYQMSINLLAFKGAEVKEVEGVKGVFIPVENNVFEGEKGAYLNLQAIEYKRMCRGNTHWMQRYTHTKEEAEEQMKQRKEGTMPYYGTMKPMFFKKVEK